MPTRDSTARRVGGERTCNQCGTTYRSPRNSSRFCSPACRKKSNRGTAPTGGPKAGPCNWSVVAKALHLAGYVGRIAPSSSPSSSLPIYALLVDKEAAYEELAFQFDQKGWGSVSRAEFDAALQCDGISG